jgi:ABC-type glycerol-3-phosphate transport system substrate-binding protein
VQLRTTRAAATLLVLLLGACGGNDSTTPSSTASPSPSPSPVTVTVSGVTASGDTATATPSSDSAYTWAATFTVTLKETAGVAATVRSLSANLQQAAGGIVITPPTGLTEKFRFNVNAGTNTLAASGELPIDFQFFYTLPNGGRQALVTVTFNLVDTNGAQIQVSATVKVV